MVPGNVQYIGNSEHDDCFGSAMSNQKAARQKHERFADLPEGKETHEDAELKLSMGTFATTQAGNIHMELPIVVAL